MVVETNDGGRGREMDQGWWLVDGETRETPQKHQRDCTPTPARCHPCNLTPFPLPLTFEAGSRGRSGQMRGVGGRGGRGAQDIHDLGWGESVPLVSVGRRLSTRWVAGY